MLEFSELFLRQLIEFIATIREYPGVILVSS